jgi:hypothetical protein
MATPVPDYLTRDVNRTVIAFLGAQGVRPCPGEVRLKADPTYF